MEKQLHFSMCDSKCSVLWVCHLPSWKVHHQERTPVVHMRSPASLLNVACHALDLTPAWHFSIISCHSGEHCSKHPETLAVPWTFNQPWILFTASYPNGCVRVTTQSGYFSQTLRSLEGGGRGCWLVSNVRPWVGTSAHSRPSLQGLKVPVTALVLSQCIPKQEAEGFEELRVSGRELSCDQGGKVFLEGPQHTSSYIFLVRTESPAWI